MPQEGRCRIPVISNITEDIALLQSECSQMAVTSMDRRGMEFNLRTVIGKFTIVLDGLMHIRLKILQIYGKI